jgi:hypothetical protein
MLREIISKEREHKIEKTTTGLQEWSERDRSRKMIEEEERYHLVNVVPTKKV